MNDGQNLMKTGTTTLGIVCKDGIVLGADRRTTLGGQLVANKKTKKVLPLTSNISVTMAGTASDAQLMIKLAQAELRLKRIRIGRECTVKEAANLMARMVYNNLRKPSMVPGISHFLMAGKDNHSYYLYDIFADGTITLVDDYVSSGSGSVMVYGVLETLYKKDMTIEEGIKLVVKSINASMQRDTASGNGIDIVAVTQEGVKTVFEKEIDSTISV
ncbi:proteasome subunit beta [Candidatus Woesearchaeota archaeon]|nr:proteasome subunit beta [Candidatus Woesearchaeota archaeon]